LHTPVSEFKAHPRISGSVSGFHKRVSFNRAPLQQDKNPYPAAADCIDDYDAPTIGLSPGGTPKKSKCLRQTNPGRELFEKVHVHRQGAKRDSIETGCL
jgi:hypothetical protein